MSCDILFIFGSDLLQVYMHIIGCASVYPCSLQGPSLGDMSSKSKLASYQELGCMCVCILCVCVSCVCLSISVVLKNVVKCNRCVYHLLLSIY